MADALTGTEFKKQLRAGSPKMGLFVNSHSPQLPNNLRIADTTGCWSIPSTVP